MPLNIKRRRRQLPVRVMEEYRDGQLRFKVTGYYIGGKRVRRYFVRREEADTFIQAETIKRENLGNRAQRIDGALAEDAIRAADLLRGHKVTIYDAARLAAEAAENVDSHGVRSSVAVNIFVTSVR